MSYPTKKLKEICNIERGGSPRPIKSFLTNNDNGINWIKIGDTKNISKYIESTEEKIKPEGAKKSRMVYPGDFILSNSMSFGRPYIMKTSGCIHDGWLVLRTDKNIINDDLLYLLLSSDFMYLKFSNATSGTTVQNLSIDKVKNISIPLPPLPTQKLIVQKLDSSFEKIDKSIELTKNNLENIEELNKSVLEEVFSEGEYKIMKMNDICEKITDGTHQTPTYFENGVKFLSSKNVTSGFIDWKNIKYIDEKQHIEMSKRVTPKKGDILLAKNGTTGVGAIVDKDEIFDIYVSLALLRPKDFILSKYLLYFINSPIAKKQFNSRLKGVGVPNLHLKEIKEVEIPIFNFEKQKEIVAQLDQVFEKNKALKESYERKLKDLEEMKQSLLKEAFEGRLVKE